MKITENYVRNNIDEICPKVEGIMGLKSNLSQGYKIEIGLEKIAEELGFNSNLLARFLSYNTNKGNSVFRSPENFAGDSNEFKTLIAHEIAHSIQDFNFSTYALFQKANFCYNEASFICFVNKNAFNDISNLVNYEAFERGFFALKCLIEGDASFVEREFNKRYLINPKPPKNDDFVENLTPMDKNNLKEFFYPYYHGEKILREQFNGDRTQINKLYNLPLGDLIEIFGKSRNNLINPIFQGINKLELSKLKIKAAL